jgi:hypothetical protein
MLDTRKRRGGEICGTLDRLLWLAGGAILIVEVIMEEKLIPTMSLGQVVPLQGPECSRVQPLVTSHAEVIRLIRVIA